MLFDYRRHLEGQLDTINHAVPEQNAITTENQLLYEGAGYFMRMNSPSGGTKEMVLSVSNFPSFTHWWNVMSASSMPVPLG